MCVRSPLLDDSSENVRRELARIVGHLSCVQSGLSLLSHDAGHAEELVCHGLCLATEHLGGAPPSLTAAFVKPFLPLLGPLAPSSVKQGLVG